MITKETLMGNLFESTLEEIKARYLDQRSKLKTAHASESGDRKTWLAQLHHSLTPWGVHLNWIEGEYTAGRTDGLPSELDRVDNALKQVENGFLAHPPKAEEPTWHPVSKPEPTTEAAPTGRVRGTMASRPKQEATPTVNELMAPLPHK